MIDLLREFGPAVTAIAFFMWRDWKREERSVLQNNELNEFIRTQLLGALKKNTLAVNRMVTHCKGEEETGEAV